MSEILKIIYPTITTYTQHAHLLAILENEPKANKWIFSNYIQLYANKNLSKNTWADFYFPMPYETRPFEICKWFEVQKNNVDCVDRFISKNDIVNYVTELIDNEYYVHMMINYKFLSSSPYHKYNQDKIHDVLIYGYDSNENVFLCADFMFGGEKYSFSKCTYNELRKAYDSELSKNKKSYMNNCIYSYKLKKKCDYEFHVNNILYGLKQYVNADFPEYWNGYNFCNKESIVCGILFYDAMVQYLLSFVDERIDLRLFCLLRDHKKMMCKRLAFLQENLYCTEDYIEKYQNLVIECTLLINIAIKYNFTHREELLNRMAVKLMDIKNYEVTVLQGLISFMSQHIEK